MTNEKKAREIATINHYEYVDKKDTLHSLAICEKSALEMAEWKDKEHKERVKKLEGLIKEEKEWQEKDRNHSWECQDAYIEGLKKALEFFN